MENLLTIRGNAWNRGRIKDNPNRWGKEGIKTAEMFRELRNSSEVGLIIQGPWKPTKIKKARKTRSSEIKDVDNKFTYWKDEARKWNIQLLFQPLKNYGTINSVAIHCRPDELDELEAYFQEADRDGFTVIYCYIK